MVEGVKQRGGTEREVESGARSERQLARVKE